MEAKLSLKQFQYEVSRVAKATIGACRSIRQNGLEADLRCEPILTDELFP
jgi:hypothetical protein